VTAIEKTHPKERGGGGMEAGTNLLTVGVIVRSRGRDRRECSGRLARRLPWSERRKGGWSEGLWPGKEGATDSTAKRQRNESDKQGAPWGADGLGGGVI
jgi:hypothetical protein